MKLAVEDIEAKESRAQDLQDVATCITTPGFRLIKSHIDELRNKALDKSIHGKSLIAREKARQEVMVIEGIYKFITEGLDELKGYKNAGGI